MDGWNVSVLPFSVIVDEGWNGKCSRNEMSLYPLPTKLYGGRGYACLAHRNQTMNGCRICRGG